MSHSVSPSLVDGSDPLHRLITGLSLTDMIGTDPVEVEPGQDSPFKAYLQEESGERSVWSVDELARDVIPQHLAQLRQTRRFLFNNTDDLYTRARGFQERYGVSEASFLNWRELLSGWMDFPAVLLPNPSDWDHLPPDEMIEISPTLSWMRDALQQTQLTLADVIILDTFPMVTNDLLESVDQKDRQELVRDCFTLALECLRYVRPRLLISCQCSAKTDYEQWGVFNDELGHNLCSSVPRAQLQRVQTVDIGRHTMQVVQGIHPVLRGQTPTSVTPAIGAAVRESFPTVRRVEIGAGGDLAGAAGSGGRGVAPGSGPGAPNAKLPAQWKLRERRSCYYSLTDGSRILGTSTSSLQDRLRWPPEVQGLSFG